MNWSLILIGLVALSSAALAENSYLVILPKLLKVGYDNQVSVFIAAASQPVEIKFDLMVGRNHVESKATCKPGETRNITLTLPAEFPVGAGELVIIGTGGIQFEERRDIVVYDNRHVILVQTSASTYRPSDTIEARVVVTNENLIPMEMGVVTVEVYDAALKLVSEFRSVPVRSGLTETLRIPIARHCNVGSWLVSATIENTTSSVEILVSTPVTPSFDLKAIFPRFLLRTEKMLRGSIEMDNDESEPIFGRGFIAIGQITEQEVEKVMKMPPKDEKPMTEEWRKWKSQKIEIAGRMELNYDLVSLFNIDVSKCLAIQVYIQVTDLISGQERVVRHVIPVFTRDIMYDIRPLEFHAGMKNEFQVIAKRPDGKPIKMENMMVTVRMMMGDEQGHKTDEKIVEIKDFYTRGRNDIGFFNVEVPETCIGVLMTLTPMSEDGQVRGYRTHAIPLMPRPRRRDSSGAKLTIELLPSTVAPVNTDVNVPVVSTQISTVGRVSNFYVQLLPMKPVEKMERLPMSYILMTNGRITLTGEFFIEPTKECQTKQVRAIRPEEQMPPVCVLNGTLPIQITREMVPYSTLIVYAFQPSFGYHVIESYRFSVAGLFQSSLTLDAKVVPFTPVEKTIDNTMFMQEWDMKSMRIPTKVQDRTRVELSWTGTPDSTVGLNVIEYDSTLQGLSTDMTKERLLKYLTTYERVPFVTMPVMPAGKQPNKMMVEPRVGNMPDMMSVRTISEKDEEMLIERERMGSKMRYPIETLFFGLSSSRPLPQLEGDDIYTTSNMGRLYGEEMRPQPGSHYRRKFQKSMTQYDVTVGDNDEVVATSVPYMFAGEMPMNKKPMPPMPQKPVHGEHDMHHDEMPTGERPQFGTPEWYKKMHTKLSSFSEEAFTLMQSGLTVVSDFDTLRIPTDMKRENLGKIFKRFREDSVAWMEGRSLGVRDEARQLLEEYIAQSDLSMMPPPIVLEEQSRIGYYRSLFFNTSRIESSGTGKVVLPQVKPYTTWLATGFSLNAKAGLSMAQPIRLPTTQGLYILGDTPKQVHVGENVLLTIGVNNYLNKDLTNVMIRIPASNDFDLMEESKPEQIISMKDKDYTMTIPSMKMMAVEMRNMIWVPKRCGMMQIIIEVESEFGGDYEVMTVFVHDDGIKREELSTRFFDLTGEKKPMTPIVEKISDSPNLRAVQVAVSGTGLDRFVHKYTLETNALVGVDRAIVRLYRSLALRRYLNETQQMDTPLFNMTLVNITKAYQKLQLFNDYDGSYSIISDEGTRQSSLYLTSLAFGAMISPMMPFRDNVTLNRTLTWILSHQQEDGSFEDNGPCFHYRFCASEFRRESLTAIVLYSLTRDNSSMFMPEFIRHRLFDGETSPIRRAQRYLESRVPDVKPHLLTITLFEMAFIQNRELSSVLRGRIQEALLSRKLTVVPEDGSRFIKIMDDKMTFDDQMLLNAMTLSIYGYYNDWQTVSDMARWVVNQVQVHPHYDTVLDAVFRTEAWLKVDCLFRKQFPKEKFAITVDVTADNGEKRQIKIDWKNMDVTQKIRFVLPVHQITYSVSGFGIAAVCVREVFVEKEQKMVEPLPFQLTHEITPMQWLTELKVKSCMTYTPTPKDMLLAVEKFNRTIVMEMELPSGMRINERQLGFFLSRVPEVMYFTYSPCGHKLQFFLNVPSTVFGKPICIEWCLQRLSTVMKWTPMEVRVYDYLQQERQLIRLFPMQLQPTVLGYTFVDAVHKVRPSLETIAKMQKRTEM